MVLLNTLTVSFKNAIRIGAFALGFLAYVTASQAQDAQYAMDAPTFTIPGGVTAQAVGTESGYYNSNPLLLTTGARSLWGSITSPELVVGDKTPTSSIASDTIFTSNNFNQSSFDSNDVHSKLNMSDKNQRWTTAFLGNVDYDTTRTSEFSSFNDLQQVPVRHLGENLSPQVTYSFLPTDKLGLAGNYSESQYANSAFTNYNSYSLSPTYTHNFDERNAGFISLQAQRYRALTGSTNVTDTVGPSFGWQKTFTPQLSGSASIGIQDTRQKTPTTPSPSWETDYNFNGNLSFKGDQDLISANASRSEYPFGNGTEALLTQISLNEIHAINALFSIGGQASYQSATYQADAFGNLKSLATGSGNFTYHATDYLDIVATYQYQHENLVGVSTNAQSNMGLLSIAYHPKPWTL